VINQATAMALSGDVIAVARGTYDEGVGIGAGIALYGACPTETILTNSRRADGTVILVTGRGAEIHDISIRDAPVSGIFVDTDASALIEGVEIASIEDTGVVVLHSEATLNRVSIRDVARRTSDGAFGIGVTIESGSTATISEFSALRCHLMGVATTGARAAFSDSVIRDVLPDPTTGVSGYSFWTRDGAEVSFSRIASIGRGGGAIITAASTAVVEDAWLDGTNGSFGVGVASLGEAEVTVSRARINNMAGAGLSASGGTLLVNDAFVHNSSADVSGQGIHVEEGSHVEVDRVHISGMAGLGIVAQGSAASFVGRDIVVDGVRQTTDRDGVGIGAFEGADVTLERAEIRRASVVALMAFDMSTVTARDLTVEDMVGAADGTWGRALHGQGGSTVEVDRLRADGLRELAISAFEAHVVLRDAQFLEIVPSAPTIPVGAILAASTRLELERVAFAEVDFPIQIIGGEFVAIDLSMHGAGIQLAQDSAFTGHRIELTDPAHFGLLAYGEATGTVTDLRIEAPTDPGHGIVVQDTGTLSVERFSVEGAPLCGVYILGDAGLDLRDGDVRGCTIGVCVDAAAYDVGRLSAGVRYEGNSTNFDGTTGMPVPEPFPPFGTGPLPESDAP